MRIVYCIILGLVALISVKAQQNNTLFLMHDLPQANIVNPSVPIECKLYIGIPFIASTHVNAYSTGFKLNDLFDSFGGDSLRFEPGEAIHHFNNLEIVATEAHLALLMLGYRYKQNYFTFSITEKFNTYQIISKNAALFAWEGNTQFEGENVNMDGLRINANHYREYAFGWARQINEKFDLGMRFKMLFGKGNIYSKPIDLSLYTDPNTFVLYLQGRAGLYSSFPVELSTDDEGKLDQLQIQDDIDWMKYAMNKANKGFGIDMGFTYRITDAISLSGSLLDIGYIKWNSNAYYYKSAGSIDVSGTMFEDGLNQEAVLDTLESVFTPEVFMESYSSPLVPAFYLGISHQLNNWFNAGVVFHSEIYKDKMHPSLTFSGNAEVTPKIFASGSYTIQNKEWNNVGLGLGARLGIFHLHAISDNITGLFDLGNTQNVNLRFGLGLLFGCNENNVTEKEIRALPCFSDPYRTVQKRIKRSRR
jgi:hypothetical protein